MFRKIIPLGGKQMNRILAVAILLGITGCSYTQPYVTNISPAGEQGILVEKCKVQYNPYTAKVSTQECNTSYVWLGGALTKKEKSEEVLAPVKNRSTLVYFIPRESTGRDESYRYEIPEWSSSNSSCRKGTPKSFAFFVKIRAPQCR